QVDLAREDGDGVVRMDHEEGVHLVGRDGLAEVAVGRPRGRRQEWRGLTGRPAQRAPVEREPDDEGPTGAQEGATRDRGHVTLLPPPRRPASPPGPPGRGCRSGRGYRPGPA